MVLVLVLGALAWCLLPLPVAVAVGRAFRAGAPEVIGSDQDARVP
jgi:hypothetical protein